MRVTYKSRDASRPKWERTTISIIKREIKSAFKTIRALWFTRRPPRSYIVPRGARRPSPSDRLYIVYTRSTIYIFFFHVQKVSGTKIIIIMKLIRARLTADEKITLCIFYSLRKSFIMDRQRKSYTIPSAKTLIHLYAHLDDRRFSPFQAKFMFAVIREQIKNLLCIKLQYLNYYMTREINNSNYI